MRALLPTRRKLAGAFDFRVAKVAATSRVTTWAATQLGSAGITLAKICAPLADTDYQTLQRLFGLASSPPANFVVAPLSHASDGSGGAYHPGCTDATLYCDCATDPRMTSALFVAELVEVFSAIKNNGWDCGATNGEGLSRVLAESMYPGALDGYAVASDWLDSQRPNFVDQNLPTDTDSVSNGCAVLFLWWLVSLGYPWDQIVPAGGRSLAETYLALTGGKSTAWQDFRSVVDARWPPGRPSGVTVDNPWPANAPDTIGASLDILGTLPSGTYKTLDEDVFVFVSADKGQGRYALTAIQ
jgi:hypothetical protein